MCAQKRDFDKAAATWDQNAARVKLTADIADAVIRQVAPSHEMDVLDFGCGTGLLTLRLQPLVRSITGADSSRGMLDVLRGKIAEGELVNVSTLLLDEEHPLTGRFDLIVSSMTLHHIPDVPALLGTFHAALRPGGCVALADLDPDGGEFHGDNTGIFHFGFERPALRAAYAAAGLEDVRDVTAGEITKPTAAGRLRTFSVFLMMGRKVAD